MKLGEQIKEARKRRKMSQKELGQRIGYSMAHISYVEGGQRQIIKKVFLKIEEVLDVKFDDFDNIPQYNVVESKADKLFKIIKLLFATPDNYKAIDEIWNK